MPDRSLSIRWKLVLAVGVPAVVVYAFILVIGTYGLRTRAVERLGDNAARVATVYAARFDAEFARLAAVARLTASTLQTSARPPDDETRRLLCRNLAEDMLIVGSCVLRGDAGGPLRSLCVAKASPDDGSCVDAAGTDDPFLDLRTPAPEGIWSRAWAPEEGSDRINVRYAVSTDTPDGSVVWITLDLGVERMHERFGPLEVGEGRFGILRPDGYFLHHPVRELMLEKSIAMVADEERRDDIRDLEARLRSGESGVYRFPDETGIRWIFYAPIRSTGWTFMTAIDESEVLAFANAQLWRGMLIMVVGTVLILASLLLATGRITGPLSSLSRAVRELSRGNLDVRVPDNTSGDEIGRLTRAFNRMVGDLRAHVATHAREVAQRESFEQELQVARRIQMSLLPRRFPPFPDHDEFDIHALSRPAMMVGGDFYDYFMVSDRQLCVTIADVSGKGVPAALYMAVARTAIRDLSIECHTAGELITRLDGVLKRSNVGSMFVTIFLGFYDLITGTLRYVNAGHPLPYLLPATGGARSIGRVTGTLVGIVDGGVFDESSVELGPGDRLVLYTDGVTEARNDGTFFGDERLRELLEKHSGDSTEKLLQRVSVRVEAFQDHVLSDDVTLVCLRRSERTAPRDSRRPSGRAPNPL